MTETDHDRVAEAPRLAVAPVSRPPLLAEQAFDRLREGLLPGGDLWVLEQLVEEDLAERLQMSRTPIREALNRLSIVGMIEDNRAGGYVPRRFTTKEIVDHYEARLALEPLAVEWACRRDAESRRLALADPDLAPSHASAAADRAFHKAVGHAAGSRPLSRLITQFVDRLAREGIHASGDHDDEQRLAVGHELVVAAIRAGDVASGVEAMREHMSLLVRLIPRGRTPAHGADARRPAARLSLADQSYHALKRAILAGEIAVGTALTEAVTAKSLEVSRTTARQAMHRLELEEYLDRDARGRLTVHRTTRAEFDQECAIRSALDTMAVRLAAERISDDELDRLEGLVAEDAEALREGDDDRRAAVNTRIHRAISVASRNRVLVEASEDLRERTFGFGRVPFAVGTRRDRKEFATEHAEIVASLRSGDGDHAAEVVAAHIERSHRLLRERMDENGNVDN